MRPSDPSSTPAPRSLGLRREEHLWQLIRDALTEAYEEEHPRLQEEADFAGINLDLCLGNPILSQPKRALKLYLQVNDDLKASEIEPLSKSDPYELARRVMPMFKPEMPGDLD